MSIKGFIEISKSKVSIILRDAKFGETHWDKGRFCHDDSFARIAKIAMFPLFIFMNFFGVEPTDAFAVSLGHGNFVFYCLFVRG